ncbi:cytochrome P450 [Mycena epipterygia]|nr:cytochrome P450 [Mycena epipterygia]
MANGIACVFAVTMVVWAVRRLRSSRKLDNCISSIPGPKSPSWIYGNMPEFLLGQEHGEHEFQWQETYGQVYSIKGCFGESRLIISDPLATKYIINNPGGFVWGSSHQKVANLLFGHDNIFLARGIVHIAVMPVLTHIKGEGHRHLRNIMNPWFSSNSVRASLPMIKETARKLVDRWESLGFPGNTADVCPILRDVTLDVMADGDLTALCDRTAIEACLVAILDYPFNALTGQSELAGTQRNIIDAVSSLTKFGLLVDKALQYIPDPVFRLACRLPIPVMLSIRKYNKVTDELSRHLVQQTRANDGSGIDQPFISRFVKRNTCDTEVGVPDDQIPVHVRTILFAGSDTSGGTLGWILYKLAEMQDFQHELRKEIQLASADDYDNMLLLNAIINEALRLYSSLPFVERVATEDCFLPLSQSITTTTGIQTSELQIKKGEYLYISIAAYHRNVSIWGVDAREFRPSRWLEKEPCKVPALGPHASFWRFAILEMQVLVTELVRKFVLTLPENDSVRACIATTLLARTSDGVHQLPIHVETVA